MSTPTTEYGMCPWPVDPACLTDEWEALPPDVQERGLMLASATLHRLTGYRVGGCPITVRPCKPSCASQSLPSYYMMRRNAWMMPHLDTAGMWINSCGCEVKDCACTEICEIVLPEPVGQIIEVSIDGIIVDFEDYRVDGANLVWTGDASCPWPTCQDMAAPLTEPARSR